jgi:hypothetical protein
MESMFQDLKSGNHITADDDFHDGKYRVSDNVVVVPGAIQTHYYNTGFLIYHIAFYLMAISPKHILNVYILTLISKICEN